MYTLLLLFFACDDHKFSGGHSTEPVTESGFAGAQAIFSGKCASCHGGNFPPLDGDLCVDVVDVLSEQSTDMLLIAAGSSEDSYLYHKLTNSHLEVGGSDGQMPLGGSLEASEIDIVAAWIDEGAPCE